MFTNLIQQSRFIHWAGHLSRRFVYWLIYILVGVTALTIALYFQHYLDEPPCVVCIQMRLLFLLLILLSVAGLYLRHYKITRSLTNLSIMLVAIAMIERSYLLLGTERGFIFADCGFDLGLPAWFAVEDWLPGLFRIETACGYTPEVFFGITMAEVLIVSSILLFLLSFTVTAADLMHTKSEQ